MSNCCNNGNSYTLPGGPFDGTLADFNGDGFLDHAFEMNDERGVGVILGDGNGSFGSVTSYAVGNSPTSILAQDYNGDGVTDLAVSNINFPFTISILLGESTPGIAPLQPFSLETLADARQALPIFQKKREQLAKQRGEIGASQARINVAQNMLTVSSENFLAAESRIRDADIAQESSDLVRLNILQQAAAAILAQANIQPSLALSLLN